MASEKNSRGGEMVTNSGRSAWFVGVLLLMVYLAFAMTLYLLPPRAQIKEASINKSPPREMGSLGGVK
jgi:Ca2+:H+ antiporter